MKKYFLMMAMAVAALTMGVSSCSKDDDDANSGFVVLDEGKDMTRAHSVGALTVKNGKEVKPVTFRVTVKGHEASEISYLRIVKVVNGKDITMVEEKGVTSVSVTNDFAVGTRVGYYGEMGITGSIGSRSDTYTFTVQ